MKIRTARTSEGSASGVITLYRGEGSHDRPSYYPVGSSETGAWWTTDLESAKAYAAGQDGLVYVIDVDESEAERRGLPQYRFIPDPEVRKRRRVLESYASRHTAGPAGNMVPFERFPILTPQRFGPKDVKVLRMAEQDIKRLHPGQQAKVREAIEALKAGTAQVEAKERHPLVGSYTVRVTNSLRLGLYLTEDQPGGDPAPDWVVYIVTDHDYQEAERRMQMNPGVRTASTDLYVRFGEIPPNYGNSFNHRDEFEEGGVSVYRLGPDGMPVNPSSGMPHGMPDEVLETMQGFVWMHQKGHTPEAYVVDGLEVGTGSDGEPLLDPYSIEIVRDWDGTPVRTAAEHTAAAFTLDSDWVPGGEQVKWKARAVDGKVAGYVLFRDVWDDDLGSVAVIDMIETNPAYARQGVATFLYGELTATYEGVKHTDEFTPEGAAWWAKVTGEHVVPNSRSDQDRGRDWTHASRHTDDGRAWADKVASAEVSYRVVYRDPLLSEGEAMVVSSVGGWDIGALRWNYHSDPPVIVDVSVEEEYRRQGIATEMYRRAREVESRLTHSDVLSDDGKAWSERVALHKKVTAAARAANLPDVGPTDDNYWGQGGCGALALAFVTLFPDLKIAVEWGTGHDEGYVWHTAAYDPVTKRSFDFNGTSRIDIEMGLHGGNVEMDVAPQRVADAMDVLRGWSTAEPWGNDLVFEASSVITEHWGVDDAFWNLGSRTSRTASVVPFDGETIYRGLALPFSAIEIQAEMTVDEFFDQPQEDIVAFIIEGFDGTGVGNHWSTVYNVSYNFANDVAGQIDGLPVLLEGTYRSSIELEDDEEILDDWNVYTDPTNMEKEVTIREGEVVTINKVYWGSPDGMYGRWNEAPAPSWRNRLTASLRTAASDETWAVADILPLRMNDGRQALNPDQVDRYVVDIRAGVPLAPLFIERGPGGAFLSDGHHRLEAAERAGLTEVPVRVFDDRWEALKALNEVERAKTGSLHGEFDHALGDETSRKAIEQIKREGARHTAADLMLHQDVFYRTHDRMRAFSVDDATSSPLNLSFDDHLDDPREGYSACYTPWDLWAYVVIQGWTKLTFDDDVLIFSGDVVGDGVDNEPLVVPDHRIERFVSWRDFLWALSRITSRIPRSIQGPLASIDIIRLATLALEADPNDPVAQRIMADMFPQEAWEMALPQYGMFPFAASLHTASQPAHLLEAEWDVIMDQPRVQVRDLQDLARRILTERGYGWAADEVEVHGDAGLMAGGQTGVNPLKRDHLIPEILLSPMALNTVGLLHEVAHVLSVGYPWTPGGDPTGGHDGSWRSIYASLLREYGPASAEPLRAALGSRTASVSSLEGLDLRFNDSDPEVHKVTAHEGGVEVGSLWWWTSSGEVFYVHVSPSHQRKGIATGLWGWVVANKEPRLHHSSDLTEEGRAWSQTVASAPERPARMVQTYPAAHGGKYHARRDPIAEVARCRSTILLDVAAMPTMADPNGKNHPIICPRCMAAIAKDWQRSSTRVAYQGGHRAPSGADDVAAPLHDVEEMMPNYYDHPEWYSHDRGPVDAETSRVIRGAKGQPDKMITIYRALPPGFTTINDGDWVTISRTYALGHAMQSDDPSEDWPVITAEVPARTLWTEGYAAEWGYDGSPVSARLARAHVGSPSLLRSAVADSQGFWYHYGTSMIRYEEGQYVHIGTREAAESRHRGMHGEGNFRHDGTLMRAKISPRNPLGSESAPLSDHDVNILTNWESWGPSARGEMPSEENGGDQRPWQYNGVTKETPMSIAARVGYRGAWVHDAFFYRNEVEDRGSISVAIDPSCITEEGEAPPTNPDVGEGQLLLWGARHRRLAATTYFHGTSMSLPVGTQITPREPGAWEPGQPTRSPMERWNDPAVAYATSSETSAWWWAEHSWNAGRGDVPRVYIVEPLGEVHPDPNGENAGDVVSTDGWRVVGESTGGDYDFWHEGALASGLMEAVGAKRPIRGNLPGYQFVYEDDWSPLIGVGFEGIAAVTREGYAGHLSWDYTAEGDPYIAEVWIEEGHRRKGVATELLRLSREIEPTLAHSDDLSDMGRSWMQAVGASGLTFTHLRGVNTQDGELVPVDYPNTDALVAREGGKDVGFILWYAGGGLSGSVDMVWVDESHRRRGLATELLRRSREIQPDIDPTRTPWFSDEGKEWANSLPGVYVGAATTTLDKGLGRAVG